VYYNYKSNGGTAGWQLSMNINQSAEEERDIQDPGFISIFSQFIIFLLFLLESGKNRKIV